MKPQDFLVSIIRPSLAIIELDGPQAEQLLLGTAIQESGVTDVFQRGGGPARGYFQMETATHNDIWTNYLRYKVLLSMRVRKLIPTGVQPSSDLLIPVPQYAVAMARILYDREPEALPAFGDIQSQAEYYKKYYNTPNGAATIQEYIDNWNAANIDPKEIWG